MSKVKLKTRPVKASVTEFVASLEHEVRRGDAQQLLEVFAEVTGWSPQMWGASIVGYGRYEYRYASGREGEFMVTGFSPRKSSLTIYIMPGYRDLGEKLARLGKHKTGKSCLYINKLSDVDVAVLKEIIEDGVSYMKENYAVFEA